jgi:hypothetical protein
VAIHESAYTNADSSSTLKAPFEGETVPLDLCKQCGGDIIVVDELSDGKWIRRERCGTCGLPTDETLPEPKEQLTETELLREENRKLKQELRSRTERQMAKGKKSVHNLPTAPASSQGPAPEGAG